MLKSRFGKRLSGITTAVGRVFSKFGLSPNAWTMLTLAVAVPGFIALYYRQLSAGLLFFFIAGCIDMVDGAVARFTKKTSAFGAFLDGVVDRYVEFLLYLGLWFYVRDAQGFILQNTVWIMLLMFGALMPSFIRAYADHKRAVTSPKDLERMGGLLERSERLDMLYVGMLAGIANTAYLVYAIALAAVLSHVTSLQRLFFVIQKQR
ncbi:MAG: CDP-alcohol phosphatidyltransferase family protein [Candidatus Altiarchaeota archaeon]|nr:CDP-alcohol phosphatidyltransferase family protein [Candidatus Altiarchaeota archaeon]